MRFPAIKELCITDVVSIGSHATIHQALEQMLESDHRNIVVIADTTFLLLSVYDVLKLRDEILERPLNTLNLLQLPTLHKETNILDAIDLIQHESELIAVIDDDESLFGIVAHSDIISSIDPDTLMDNYRLRDFVKSNKSSRWISKNSITSDVLNDIQRYCHDSAIIVEARRPIGILTTKDVLHLLKEQSDLSQPVEVYMSAPVETIHYDSTINEALRRIKDKHYKRIVTVNDEGKLIGIITQKELITITYSRWVVMMKEYQQELNEINRILKQKSERYEKIAGTDPLTGLYNRIKFVELYVSEYTVMTKRQNAMSLILIDLDHFKTINDSYGHNTGDKVLKQVSNLLLQTLRSVDILCRWGGEEFVALLPSATADQAQKIAENIRYAIQTLKRDDIPQITASFGVTQIIEGETLEDAIHRADTALYKAKDSGRNTVTTQ